MIMIVGLLRYIWTPKGADKCTTIAFWALVEALFFKITRGPQKDAKEWPFGLFTQGLDHTYGVQVDVSLASRGCLKDHIALQGIQVQSTKLGLS